MGMMSSGADVSMAFNWTRRRVPIWDGCGANKALGWGEATFDAQAEKIPLGLFYTSVQARSPPLRSAPKVRRLLCLMQTLALAKRTSSDLLHAPRTRHS